MSSTRWRGVSIWKGWWDRGKERMSHLVQPFFEGYKIDWQFLVWICNWFEMPSFPLVLHHFSIFLPSKRFFLHPRPLLFLPNEGAHIYSLHHWIINSCMWIVTQVVQFDSVSNCFSPFIFGFRSRAFFLPPSSIELASLPFFSSIHFQYFSSSVSDLKRDRVTHFRNSGSEWDLSYISSSSSFPFRFLPLYSLSPSLTLHSLLAHLDCWGPQPLPSWVMYIELLLLM